MGLNVRSIAATWATLGLERRPSTQSPVVHHGQPEWAELPGHGTVVRPPPRI